MQYYATEDACANVGYPSPMIRTKSDPIRVGAPDVGYPSPLILTEGAPIPVGAPDVGYPSPLILTESAPIHVCAPDVGAMQGIMPFAALRRGNEWCSEYIFSGTEKSSVKSSIPVTLLHK